MAKKSAATKHTSAPRRPTTSGSGTAKRPAVDQSRVTLVRAPSTATATEDAPKTPAATETKPAAEKPETAVTPKAPARGAASPAASAPTKPAAAPAAAAATRMPAARAPQRPNRQPARRTNPLVTPEHYAYVRADLIRTAVLATAMFAIIIVAYFILHAHGQA
jgi:hypothetical protein